MTGRERDREESDSSPHPARVRGTPSALVNPLGRSLVAQTGAHSAARAHGHQVVQKSCHRSPTCDSFLDEARPAQITADKPEINKPARDFENSGLRWKWHGVC